ncbi:MAG: hypothetical protein H0X67_09730 [Acidobacteria bacterium]|nr:hypothetical protein [Acidobacteriota bacterium]
MMMASYTTQWGRAAAVAGVGALLLTVGCGGAENASSVRAQELTAAQAGAPVVVSCEPHQRTLVRQAVVNGAAVSQVECVAADPAQAQAQALAAQQALAYQAVTPVTYAVPAPQVVQRQAPVRQVVYEDVQPAQVVRPAQSTGARPVQARQVVYREAEPVQENRSVKKSAVIIGSSAGVGAGVGAAVGGKKGALIGAAIGGGGATIWDQATRRK